MATPIIMPKAGMAMEEGVIVQWLKHEGDAVDKGEAILEIETDKVTMDVEADFGGTLLKILSEDGATVPVTQTIGWIGEKGEAIPEIQAPSPASAPKADTPAASPTPAVKVISTVSGRIPSTPAAKRIAAERGIDLRTVTPTGKHGEVLAADVKAAALPTPVLPATVLPPLADGDRREPITGMRKVIAERMTAAHQQIPSAYLQTRVDVTDLDAYRDRLKRQFDEKITYNDFVVKAVSVALKRQPRFNTWTDGAEIVYKSDINVGLAVALPDGLVVPVLRNADRLSLRELSATCKAMITDARDGRLPPDAFADGTFTITNLGMYGITAFAPIINLPQVAILGVCAIEDVLKMIDGVPTERKIMALTITIDHRVIDGAQGAIFLSEVKQLLEDPILMLAGA